MKLLFENWRKYLDEVMQFSVSDYRDPDKAPGIMKNKLGVAYRTGKSMFLTDMSGNKYKVTYDFEQNPKSPWAINGPDGQNNFEDLSSIIGEMEALQIDFSSAEMKSGRDPDTNADDAAELRDMKNDF